jgi:hypothetical protein
VDAPAWKSGVVAGQPARDLVLLVHEMPGAGSTLTTRPATS